MLAPTLVALTVITVVAGQAGRIARPRLRSAHLLAAAALVRLSAALPPLAAGASSTGVRAAVIAADLLLGAFCLANWSARTSAFRVGLALVLAGAALNAFPTLWSGAMPFSPSAASAARVSAAEIADPVVGHVALTDQPAAVAALSDVLPFPGLRSVASLGDVVLLVGATAVAGALLPRRTSRRS